MLYWTDFKFKHFVHYLFIVPFVPELAILPNADENSLFNPLQIKIIESIES